MPRFAEYVVIGLAMVAVAPRTAWAADDAGTRSTLERVRARGELTWGADEQGGEPYAYEDAARGGVLTGFEVELADALARALGVRARFVQCDWSVLIPALERGSFDIALNGIEVTPARAARVAFSRPYYLFSERLVARAGDGRIRDLASLRGLRVGTLASSQAWDVAGAAGAVAVSFEGADEPFVDLAHGRIDAVVLDDIIVSRYAPRHPNLVVVGDVAEGRYAVALRPGDRELREAIDRALEGLIASGAWRQILARYGLDGPRQDGLAAATAAPPPGTSRARALTPRQLALFLEGAVVTLLLSLVAMALAAPFGLLLAIVRLESRRFGPLAAVYVEVVRGTPVLLQLYLLYFGLADVVALSPWTAAIVGLGLNTAAYEAEIYRGAIAAIPIKQWESGLALGLSRNAVLRHVVLPQALRNAAPGATNDFISLLKDSSLVSVLTVVELTKRMTITAIDNRSWLVPGLLCAALYFLLGYPLTRLARRLERRPSARAGA
jgi:polar amino acid transport system substrate-binding protein